ncbi:MAG: ABC transporter ATP-binding protein [Rhodospirillaceae bacterium]|nr:ABC transporter ATP-binding protein [Rhodospirillaceae bacterium]
MSLYFEARDLVVRYDRVSAVRGVSISLRQGEVVALVGANGAGKTSILRAATGLTRPAGGEIWFDGHRLDGQNIDRIVTRGVVMVPEGRRIFPYMNVRDNLLLGAHRRRGSGEIRADLDRVYQRFPVLRERQRQQGGSLSGGEQQMVSMGRALMARPKLLLLDEPSLGLAPMMVREIARAITAINADDGVSVILVEQNSRMALKISHRAYVLETGSVALAGPSDELMGNDHVRRVYLGG